MASTNNYSRQTTALTLSDLSSNDVVLSSDCVSPDIRVHWSDSFHGDSRVGTPRGTASTQHMVDVKNSHHPNVKKISKVLVPLVIGITMVAIVIVVVILTSKSNHDDSNSHESTYVKEETFTSTSSPDAATNSTQQTMNNTNRSTTAPHIGTTTTPVTNSTSGDWLSWSSWTDCGITCGVGIHVRYRTCNRANGTSCEGLYKQTEECGVTPCPVYGKWNTWSSWSYCSVSCADGIHARTRECIKDNIDDVDCVGSAEQTSSCSPGPCPDCSLVCQTGSLNTDCNMCVCNQNINGHVVSTSDVRIPGVGVYANTAVQNLFATSDSNGEFALTDFCTGDSVIIKLTGFVTQTVEITSLSPALVLYEIEWPYMKTQHRRKARLIGENLTLCCSAEANPSITYYEWFKDSIMLDGTLYPDGSTLVLDQLRVSDNGEYSCRGNNDYGSIESQAATLTVHDSPDEFCSSSLTQKRMHLPFDCVQSDTNSASIEVGECRKDTCRQSGIDGSETCEDETQNCCTVSDFDMIIVQCAGYTLSVMRVTACGCGACDSRRIKIVGEILVYKTDNVVQFATVYLNGEYQTFSNYMGLFTFHVPDELGTATINIEKNGISATKVIDLSDDTSGTIFVTMYLIENDQRVLINSQQDNSVLVGDNTANPNGAVAEIFIPAQSFVDSSLTRHDGQLYIDIAFLNATQISDIDVMPGVMASINEDGQSIVLRTFGAFHMSFRSYGTNETLFLVNSLNVDSGTLIESFKSNSGLYKLQTASGFWRLMPTESGVFGQILPTDTSKWIAVAQNEYTTSQNVCYFKIRVYVDKEMISEMTNSRYQTFIQAVHISSPFSFETYGHTFSPSTTCFRTICDDGDGYLEVWISNFETSSDEYLQPSNPDIHSDTGISQSSREIIKYSVSYGDEHLGLKFVRSSNGPFYESETECLVKSETDNHFKFYFQNETENVYTLAEFFDITSENMTVVLNTSQRVWYQKRAEGYRMCYVKVKVDIQNAETLIIRAISTGGTNENITDTVLGMRDLTITATSTACLEYKCSGTIGEDYFTNTYDYTKVTIKHVSPNSVACVVNSFSQDLIDIFDNNPDNTDSNEFTFYAPVTYAPNTGVYSASTSSGDFESARTIARGECESGTLMDYTSINPNDGLAVSFSCS